MNSSLQIEWAIERCFASPDDEEALSSFDVAFRPHVLAVLTAIYRDEPSLAVDAYHSAVLKYIEIFREGQRHRSPPYTGYFVAIAKNMLINELRQLERYVSFDELANEAFPSTASRDDASVVLFEGISKLERRCQFILESYYIAGTESARIAAILGMQPDSVHMAIKRCRDALKVVLGVG